MVTLRPGDDHNLLGNRSAGDPHPQYLNRAGGTVGGTWVFDQPVEFRKGITIHTDPDPADDPQGDTQWQSNSFGGPFKGILLDADSGQRIEGSSSIGDLTPGNHIFNVQGAMKWPSITPVTFPHLDGFLGSGLEFIIYVNQDSVHVNLNASNTRPRFTPVTVKSITGTLDPNIRVNVNSPGTINDVFPFSWYEIHSQYGHPMFYHDGARWHIM
jgi:hypothetical protein